MQVTVYGPLRSATGGKSVRVEADPDTVGDAVDAFVEAYPRAEQHLVDPDGDLRSSVRLTVAGDRVGPSDPFPAGAALAIHPAMRGG